MAIDSDPTGTAVSDEVAVGTTDVSTGHPTPGRNSRTAAAHDSPASTHGWVPGAGLDPSRVAGHWLLARMGKRVLRPGGVETTRFLLDGLGISPGDDVVEVAPGLGATTRLILDADPASYTGVDRDPDAAGLVAARMAGPNRRVINATAADTGLPDGSADVAIGEAYLTMQPHSAKQRIISELARVVRPGGRLALHEVAFAPEDISDQRRDEVSKSLTSSIKVNVKPHTVGGWEALLAEHGFEVTARHIAPLALLEPARLIADEGVGGAARFTLNVARNPAARKRVLAMRHAMASNAANLSSIGLVATRTDGS